MKINLTAFLIAASTALGLLGVCAADESIAPLKASLVGTRSLLTDAGGRVLYTYDPDKANTSNCNGGCAHVWPPLTFASDVRVADPLARFNRNDGSGQISYDGHPLYYYTGDDQALEASGDGLGGVWHVVVF